METLTQGRPTKCSGCPSIFFTKSLKNPRKFCSRSCYLKSTKLKPIKCLGCKTTFTPADHNRTYCSWACYKASKNVDVTCKECSVIFTRRLSEVRENNLCSRNCRNIFTSKLLGGDGTWVPRTKSVSKIYSYGCRSEWRRNRRLALERDEYMCTMCFGTEDLHVHHWEPYWISCDSSLDNLVTLCRSCHLEKHEEYRMEGFYEDVAIAMHG